MQKKSSANLIIGLGCVVFAAAVLFVWIPLDVDSGIIEKVRRRLTIGDALAPATAAIFVLIGGISLILFERRSPDQPIVQREHLRYIAIFISLIVLCLTIIRFSGPIAVEVVNILTADQREYRLLRDTVVWKYIGFFLGGTMMVSCMIMLIEGKFSWRSLSIGVLAVIAMIVVFDLPFDDLLLPPNGDV